MSNRWKARLAQTIAFICCFSLPLTSNCQPLNQTRVLSVVEDASGNFLVVNTSSQKPPGAPVIQYFPGSAGETIMVADFNGLVWNRPYGVINTKAGTKVKQIRFGQFQENPPIFRISISSLNPTSLRQIAFKTAPGSLIVKWSSTNSIKRKSEAPQLPPEIKSPLVVVPPPVIANIQSPEVAPPLAPPIVKKKPQAKLPEVKQLELRPAISIPVQQKPQLPAPGLPIASPAAKTIAHPKIALEKPPIANPLAATAPAQFNPVSNSARRLLFTPLSRLVENGNSTNWQTIETVINAGSATIKLHGGQPIAYRTFRLHDPERYVIDIDGMPELLTTDAPVLENNSYLNSIRVGSPSSGESMARVVLDLTNPALTIREKLTDNDSLLSLTISEKISLTDDLTAPAGTKVVLDAGHGGSDPGAQRSSVQEKELTLAITEKLKRALIEKGVKVEMTRYDDTFVSLEDRVKLTNASNPDAFVSVHINSLETASAIQGIETYYQTEQSKPLADVLHQSLVSGLQVPDRNVRKARFYVINHTEVPAVLAEVGYITNKDEREKLISSDYQNQVADALARGVILYLNKHYQQASLSGVSSRINQRTN